MEMEKGDAALLCFDVDGTLETGLGPIAMATLQELEAQGHAVVIVSPSPLRPQGSGFPEFLSRDRARNLEDAASAYPAFRPVYISDNPGDDALSARLGFTYVYPDDFPHFLARLSRDGTKL